MYRFDIHLPDFYIEIFDGSYYVHKLEFLLSVDKWTDEQYAYVISKYCYLKTFLPRNKNTITKFIVFV